MAGSVEDFCQDHPERAQRLLAAVDLDRPGLEQVRDAVARDDTPAACAALLDWYRTGPTADWLRVEPPAVRTEKTDPTAERILQDTFTFYSVTERVPRRPDGGLDWHFCGSRGRDVEWAMALNRHFHLKDLVEAWERTGNPAYVRTFDEHLRDWILANPYPGRRGRGDTVDWRGLETAFRMKNWSEGFYALQPVPEFTDEARLLLLSSVPEHADYLRRFHAAGGNWVTMEMDGLATAGACWPEFRDARAWVEYAVERMAPELDRQVYPDGAQKELTSSYHYVALRHFEQFREVVTHAGVELPPGYEDGVRRMWNYLAWVLRPDGGGPLNNDADRGNYRAILLEAARRWNEPEWAWIATNGAEGKKPDSGPSIFFPWAGQLVMRSGWGEDAVWAFFDLGPLGLGHEHYDKLHLSVSAGGRDLLVDSGRYTYRGGPWRAYFVGSSAHNVILVDGAGQKPWSRIVKHPLKDAAGIGADAAWAEGVFDGGYGGVEGKAVHRRSVVWLPGERCWVVTDRIATDRPRELTALWHFHPSCTVETDGDRVGSVDHGETNLLIVPIGAPFGPPRIVKGAEDPIQGWWSVEYNRKEAAPCAIYDGRIGGDAEFRWILMLWSGEEPRADVPELSRLAGISVKYK